MNERDTLAAAIDANLIDVAANEAQLPDRLTPAGWWIVRQAYTLGWQHGLEHAQATIDAWVEQQNAERPKSKWRIW